MIKSADNINQYEELIKVFLPPGEYEICREETEASSQGLKTFDVSLGREEVKRRLYRDLEEYTGKSPKWGILTGIRPVKLAGEMRRRLGSPEEVKRLLAREYLLSEEKAGLVLDTLLYQEKTAGRPEKGKISLYVGIPFCPTRCLYCSFASNQADKEEMDRYMKALEGEIDAAAEETKKSGFSLESLYIGGGTPTALDEKGLEGLLRRLEEGFDISGLREFTVEAGRPDTITEGKLSLMKEAGVDRISINPQTMNEETLKIIGRSHSVSDTYRAFDMAQKTGFRSVNSDLIAGLPGESTEDFFHSLDLVTELGADNITLHTLAVKRASRLKEADERYNYRNEAAVDQMLSGGRERLALKGYRPYYLYRQKHTSGNTENTGFCRDDKISLYNIRIMEEAQSILALGAGAISKVYFPAENRLERVANVTNYQIYIERTDEMIQRKKRGFFAFAEEIRKQEV